MKILISREQLELLLEKKRDFIGKKITIDTIIAGISFLSLNISMDSKL